jgi:hypothetical protein
MEQSEFPDCNSVEQRLPTEAAVIQLIKNSPLFIDPEVHYRVYNSPPLDHILSQLNPHYILTSVFL